VHASLASVYGIGRYHLKDRSI